MIYTYPPPDRTDSYSNPSKTIVASWPGVGTADTVYETEDGRTFMVTGSAIPPEGYTWAEEVYTSNTLPLRVAPEPLPGPKEGPQRSGPDYPVLKPKPFKAAPKVRPDFKVFQRQEFHARSNPRRSR